MARFDIRNLSAMENGDLGSVELKMKQIIEVKNSAKMDKDEDRARQARQQILESCVIYFPVRQPQLWSLTKK